MSAHELSWTEALAWRARRHHLDERVPRGRMLDVVSRLCGVHAQVMSSAELTLWARVEGLERSAVADALWTDRTLVKTWAMRGTLHLLPAAELGLWHGALATYEHYRKAGWLRGFGISAEEFTQLLDGVRSALDGRELTREELADEVTNRTGSRAIGDHVRGSWGPMLKPAAFMGDLCFAPGSGSTVRFTSPRSWIGETAATDPQEALREVVRRFLAVHAPATREELARWWATTPAKAGRLLKDLGDEAVEVDVEGAALWMAASQVAAAAAAAPAGSVRLLPAFDQYVVAATRHVDQLTPVPAGPRIYRPQGWLTPVVMAGGRFEALWKHERKGKRLLVTFEPLAKLPKAVRTAAEHEAQRLADFLGGELAVDWLT